MIISVLSVTFQEGKADEGLAAVGESLARTRGFDGCLGVDVSQDVSDPHRVMVVERWETLEKDTAYRAFAAANPMDSTKRLGATLAGPPVKFIGEHRADI